MHVFPIPLLPTIVTFMLSIGNAWMEREGEERESGRRGRRDTENKQRRKEGEEGGKNEERGVRREINV